MEKTILLIAFITIGLIGFYQLKAFYTGIIYTTLGLYCFAVSNNKLAVNGILSLGYASGSVTYNLGFTSGAASASGIYWGLGVGSRYYFTEKLDAFAELGIGGSDYSNLSVGAAFKF